MKHDPFFDRSKEDERRALFVAACFFFGGTAIGLLLAQAFSSLS